MRSAFILFMPGRRAGADFAPRHDLRRVMAKNAKIVSGWDFDRIIPCHGDVIETGGKHGEPFPLPRPFSSTPTPPPDRELILAIRSVELHVRVVPHGRALSVRSSLRIRLSNMHALWAVGGRVARNGGRRRSAERVYFFFFHFVNHVCCLPSLSTCRVRSSQHIRGTNGA